MLNYAYRQTHLQTVTVRHETLMNKIAQLNISDNIYNWIKAFFEQHFHCTRYAGECSTVAAVKASVM